MPSILFVHENFPAQFGGLATYLAQRGWKVVFATAAEHVASDGCDHMLLPGVHVVGYRRARDLSKTIHPYLTGSEKAVLNGQAFARLGAALQKGAFTPDIVVAHSGWGSGAMAKVVWPNAKFVQYLEWWYNIDAVDIDPNECVGTPEDRAARTLCRNLPFLLDAQSADAILVPTQFQASQIPDLLQPLVHVLHDGVDQDFFRPRQDGDAQLDVEGLPHGSHFITYATRGMEPMRGFPQFMAAWAKLQKIWPELHCIIAGSDRTCYGAQPARGMSYKQQILERFDFDMDRLHFVGLLPKSQYRALLQSSNAHVYLTRPFVLSWSLIETMMCGTPIVTSRTPPVQEAAPDGSVSYVAIDQPDEIVSAVTRYLEAPDLAQAQGRRARRHAQMTYATSKLHPKHEAFFHALITGVDEVSANPMYCGL